MLNKTDLKLHWRQKLHLIKARAWTCTERWMNHFLTFRFHSVRRRPHQQTPIVYSAFDGTTTHQSNFYIYIQAVLNVLKEEAIDKSGGKLGGRELLDLIIRKWGVAYDIQLRKNKVTSSLPVCDVWSFNSLTVSYRNHSHLEMDLRTFTSMSCGVISAKNLSLWMRGNTWSILRQ